MLFLPKVKKAKKYFKKVLTRKRVSDIISRLSAKRTAVWSLKIEQQREKYKAKISIQRCVEVCERIRISQF